MALQTYWRKPGHPCQLQRSKPKARFSREVLASMPARKFHHDIRRTVKTSMLNSGVDKVHRDIIFGHALHGMEAHYMAPSENDLHRAMTKYTEWLDSHILPSVDQNVDQDIKKMAAKLG